MVSVTKALINNELSLILNKMYLSSFFTTIRVVGQSAALRPFYYPVCFISPSVISSPPMSAQVCLGVEVSVLHVVIIGTLASTGGSDLNPGQVQNTAGKGLSW